MNKLFAALALIAAPVMAHADEPQKGDRLTSFYIGGGQNSYDHKLDRAAGSIGFMRQSPTSRLILGFDVASEGYMVDSTWSAEHDRESTSINALVGANLYTDKHWKWDAAALIGAREKKMDCPDSYLGFQCYADQDPGTEWEVNFGVVSTVSYDKFLVGARLTGESAQALVGFRF